MTTTDNTKIISSQRYIDAETVEEKRANADYAVVLGKVFAVDGESYQVLIDGHHSLAAAEADGAEPTITTATPTECDREAIEDIDEYLESHYIDSDWYDIATGETIWT